MGQDDPWESVGTNSGFPQGHAFDDYEDDWSTDHHSVTQLGKIQSRHALRFTNDRDYILFKMFWA
jgi:hypothetical protein